MLEKFETWQELIYKLEPNAIISYNYLCLSICDLLTLAINDSKSRTQGKYLSRQTLRDFFL